MRCLYHDEGLSFPCTCELAPAYEWDAARAARTADAMRLERRLDRALDPEAGAPMPVQGCACRPCRYARRLRSDLTLTQRVRFGGRR